MDKTKLTNSKLNGLVKRNLRILFKCTSIFPFTLFPDELIIDERKVTIIQRLFLSSGQIRSIEIEDIFNVTVDFQPFFAKIEIADRYFEKQPAVVRYLKKEDARKARRIIEGMVLINKEKIDIKHLSKDEIVTKAQMIGKAER